MSSIENTFYREHIQKRTHSVEIILIVMHA
jgi:hypothetical protein